MVSWFLDLNRLEDELPFTKMGKALGRISLGMGGGKELVPRLAT